ncbi:lytic transglycosylase domain-containing protein [Thalassobius sp. Cn5-15]|uniref:lytic transglycosylase domain-containing protein n=1 Tax=Thalassobius sp. Cn5-15 TaxID=2917763 RepID=UPI001EF39A4B|nr:lytic transglycosylase domain-containing protein [Thalassobius sp. Cn5-15]MCG7492608.1 lytic transglycosylase domain-containing protein [Thalassobius sp. Cn5-15]
MTSTRAVAVAIGLCAVLTTPVLASDVHGSQGRVKLLKSQTDLLDGRLKRQSNLSISLAAPRVNTPTKWDDELGRTGFKGKYSGPFLDMARSAARRHNIPETMFLKLVQQESGFNAKAVSPKGALGLAQLMPATAKTLGVDPRDPYENLEGGARYLAEQYRAFGSWRLALAAYNAGPGAVKKHGGIPPYKETRNYVRIILGDGT